MLTFEYLARLIDGEGSITLTKERAASVLRRPVLSVQMCEEGLIRRLASTFGGAVTRRKARKERHSDAYTWQVTNALAVSLLDRLVPHLQVANKKLRAELIVNEVAPLIKANGKYTADEIEQRLKLEDRFFQLTPTRMSPI